MHVAMNIDSSNQHGAHDSDFDWSTVWIVGDHCFDEDYHMIIKWQMAYAKN